MKIESTYLIEPDKHWHRLVYLSRSNHFVVTSVGLYRFQVNQINEYEPHPDQVTKMPYYKIIYHQQKQRINNLQLMLSRSNAAFIRSDGELLSYKNDLPNSQDVLKMRIEIKDKIYILDGIVQKGEAQVLSAAIKHAVWTAAASGDAEELKRLLRESPEVDLYSLHDGKSIIQRMFDADPKNDLPLSTEQPDYEKTLQTLIDVGKFDFKRFIPSKEKTYLAECDVYRHSLKPQFMCNPIHLKLLRIIDNIFYKKNHSRTNNWCNYFSCAAAVGAAGVIYAANEYIKSNRL